MTLLERPGAALMRLLMRIDCSSGGWPAMRGARPTRIQVLVGVWRGGQLMRPVGRRRLLRVWFR